MAAARVGYTYECRAEKGLAGELTGVELHPEMAALDMPAGASVKVVAIDDDRGGLVLAEWVDGNGTPRTTSIEPDAFASLFKRS